MYVDERSAERKVLCDPVVRLELDRRGIRLCSFTDVDARRGFHSRQGLPLE
jgi:predicted glycoside hydrolase/deacetylase ChbG (UPF0249 family)